MKAIKNIGLALFILAISLFSSLLFLGEFEVTPQVLEQTLNEQQKNNLLEQYNNKIVGKTYATSFALSSDLRKLYKEKNAQLEAAQDWNNVMWDKPHDFAYPIVKASAKGLIANNINLFLFLTFGLGILGGLLFIIPNYKILGVEGIKNNGIFLEPASNKGWVGWIVFGWLVLFYLFLYITPDYISNWIIIIDPVSNIISGNPGSQWFLYGLLYCTVMMVMGVRMMIKYRHNKYQLIRTTVVIFFQVAFAFIIPEILVKFNMPYMDFKNAWPLDYDFLYQWNIDKLIANGNVGIFMLVWGITLTIIIVPVFSYFFGKRWYCSWVCGCGGLAETLGDPYRQLSNKKIWAWKLERWLIHSVLVFAILMTALTLYSYFMGINTVLGIQTYTVQKIYGGLIGTVFSGVIGTGFYPIFGNRTWCRFGCPLAAYMGLVQRFRSRFRITVNGGQCISCGNCSTYCEQGIDVRAYAQAGQNIVRASCVGCGVCSAVCPRGVLKLENAPEDGRIKANPILIGADIKLP